jgi:hypothetical protein
MGTDGMNDGCGVRRNSKMRGNRTKEMIGDRLIHAMTLR